MHGMCVLWSGRCYCVRHAGGYITPPQPVISSEKMTPPAKRPASDKPKSSKKSKTMEEVEDVLMRDVLAELYEKVERDHPMAIEKIHKVGSFPASSSLWKLRNTKTRWFWPLCKDCCDNMNNGEFLLENGHADISINMCVPCAVRNIYHINCQLFKGENEEEKTMANGTKFSAYDITTSGVAINVCKECRDFNYTERAKYHVSVWKDANGKEYVSVPLCLCAKCVAENGLQVHVKDTVNLMECME